MKKFFTITLCVLVISIFSNNTLFASHMMGSDMTWRCVGKDSFLVKIVVYRDCNGIALGGSTLFAYCNTTGSTITSVGTNPGNPVDITPTCKGSCDMCTNSGCSFPYGIDQYTMTNLIVLSSAGSCCDIRLSWEQSARNVAITTGASGEDFTIEDELDLCNNPCENSPAFSNPPIAILCVGQPFTYNQGVTDDNIGASGGLMDSLTYQWTEPLQEHGNPTTWNGNYTYDNPLDYYGFPNQNLPPPRGFHLDAGTGDIQFEPMQVEITIMAMMVNQYRNGVLIGQIRRDMQVIIINCPTNHPPTITTPNNITYKEVCAGSQVTFNFSTNDQDAPDTVTISWNAAIPGAQWTNTNKLAKHPTGTLSWTPGDQYVSSIPYSFTVTAQDNACPIKGTFTKSYQILVKPRPKANITIADSGCGNYWMWATPVVGAAPSYLWQGGTAKNYFTSPGRVVEHHLSPGINPISMVMTAAGCSTTYFDTIKVDTFLTMYLPNNFNTCIGTKVTLTAQTQFAKGAVKYKWWSEKTIFPETGPTKVFFVTKDTTIFCLATDTSRCFMSDSTHIVKHNMPVVELGPDQRICYGGKVIIKETTKLDKSKVSSKIWTNILSGLVLNTTDTFLVVEDSGRYRCTVRDTLGCTGSDSMRVYINANLVSNVMGKVKCKGDTVQLVTNSTGGGNAIYSWYKVTKSGTDSFIASGLKIVVNPPATTDYWLKISETTAGVTCKDSQKITVLINSLPGIKISLIPSVCINASPVDLNKYVTVNGSFKFGGIWSSPDPGLIGTNFVPINAGVGYHWERYAYTDPTTGCYNKDSGRVKVNPLPTVNAGNDDSTCTGYPKITLNGNPTNPPGDWKGIGVGGTFLNWYFDPKTPGLTNGTKYSLVYHYTDTNKCENYDTMKMMVFVMPVVSAGKYNDMCIDGGKAGLSGTPAGGFFSGAGMSGTSFDPAIAGPGVHTITYTYTNVICQLTDTTTITVWPLPVVTANTTSGRTDFCKNEGLVSLNGLPAGGSWGGPGITNGTWFDPSICGNSIRVYILTYTFMDIHGCVDSATLNIKVRPMPGVFIDTAAKTLCFGQPYNIKAMWWNATGVEWYKGSGSDGSIIGSVNDSVVSYQPGKEDMNRLYFWLGVTTTDSIGVCKAVFDSIKVKMSAMPVANFVGVPLSGCVPLTVSFTDSSTIGLGIINYWEWDMGDGTKQYVRNPVYTYNNPGKYSISLKIKSDAGCENVVGKQDYVNVYIIPIAKFIVIPSITKISVPTVNFTNQTQNVTAGINYLWDFGDGSGTSKAINPSYRYQDTGHYTVVMMAKNEWGCSDTTSNTVVIMPDVLVYIPNAFTPNGSGPRANEKFRAQIEGITTFDIKIYSRWGQLLYQSQDYETHGWNGTYLDGSSDVPMDVYIYVIRVSGVDGGVYKYSGSITLIR